MSNNQLPLKRDPEVANPNLTDEQILALRELEKGKLYKELTARSWETEEMAIMRFIVFYSAQFPRQPAGEIVKKSRTLVKRKACSGFQVNEYRVTYLIGGTFHFARTEWYFPIEWEHRLREETPELARYLDAEQYTIG